MNIKILKDGIWAQTNPAKPHLEVVEDTIIEVDEELGKVMVKSGAAEATWDEATDEPTEDNGDAKRSEDGDADDDKPELSAADRLKKALGK